MPLKPEQFNNMLGKLLEHLPPSTFEVLRGSTQLEAVGYLRERSARSASGMGEVGRQSTVYVVEGSLQPGDVLGDEYVVYDSGPSHGFDEAWELIRIPPYDQMRTYTLTFKAIDGWTEDPDTGNRVPTRIDVVVQAVLKPVRDPKLIDMMGVRPGEVALEGYAVDPKELPPEVIEQTEASLTIDGVTGTFTLGPKIPDPMPAKRVAFGEYLIGRWIWHE